MKRIVQAVFLLILYGLPLFGQQGQAQGCYTKSGTYVTPVPRLVTKRLPESTETLQRDSKSTTVDDPTAGTYLVVTRPDLLEPLQPLLRWKRQQGYRVEVLCPTTHRRDSIREMLVRRYRESTPLRPSQRYVLLVGDYDRIQSFTGRHTPSQLNNTPTDLYYGVYTGYPALGSIPILPDAMVGRLSVADADELQTVIGKLIAYEQGTGIGQQLLLVAGREETPPAPTTTNGQVNYLLSLADSCRPDLQATCFRNNGTDNTAAILEALHTPTALVSYTGHGLRSGWSNPTVTASSFDTLGAVPTIVVNNCCYTNAFNGDCFGEQLLRMPSGGAVGIVGATNETLWMEDYLFAVGAKRPATLYPAYDATTPGAFDPLFTGSREEEAATLGALLWRGCQAVADAGSRFDAYYWEAYNLLGDPTTVPFLGTPGELQMALDSVTIPVGGTLLSLWATPGCRVSVTDDSSLLGTGIADENGLVTLDLARSVLGDSLTLTATRPGDRPTTLTYPTTPSAEGRLAIVGYSITDSSLQIRLRNVGQSPASQHTLHMWMANTETPLEWQHPGVIDPGGETEATLTLPVSLRCEELVRGTLELRDGQGMTYGTLKMMCEPPQNRIEVISTKITTPTGQRIRMLLPGHSYLLQVTATGHPDSATALLNSQRITAEQGYSTLIFPFTLGQDSLRLHATVTLYQGCRPVTDEWWMACYRPTETFESGTDNDYPWLRADGIPWTVDSTVAYEGRYCLRSGAVDYNQQTLFGIDIDAMQDDSVSFFYRVSSEASDQLLFHVDGQCCGFWGGLRDWQRFVYPITAGRHRLTWSYVKDGSLSEREDGAWIDNIGLPLCRWMAPYGDPAADRTHSDTSMAGITLRVSCAEDLTVWPNPSSGVLTVDIPGLEEVADLRLIDLSGRQLARRTIYPGNTRFTIDTRQYPSGTYWITLKTTAGTQTKKIIIIH